MINALFAEIHRVGMTLRSGIWVILYVSFKWLFNSYGHIDLTIFS